MGKPRKLSAAAELIGLGGHRPVDPDVLKARIAERDARIKQFRRLRRGGKNRVEGFDSPINYPDLGIV